MKPDAALIKRLYHFGPGTKAEVAKELGITEERGDRAFAHRLDSHDAVQRRHRVPEPAAGEPRGQGWAAGRHHRRDQRAPTRC